MNDRHITLAHGNGGRRMRALIEEVFREGLGAASPENADDAAPFAMPPGQPVITTDGFTVQPLEFPGGDIGALAVHGTVNDLAVSGADPVALTLNAFIEEGTEIDLLRRLVASMGQAARRAGVRVLAGDTKVLPRGHGGGVYFATTGVGVRAPGLALGTAQIQPGDAILVSGPVGDHGTAVLLAREDFGLSGDLRSDADSVLPLTRAVRALPGLRFMRDPTRGGLATVLHEVAAETGLSPLLNEDALPVRAATRTVCEMLGYDPLFLACEGRVVAIVAADQAEEALALWRDLDTGQDAAIIGQVASGPARLTLTTTLGGTRVIEELEEDPLPRIC